jgi:hypothetical protein
MKNKERIGFWNWGLLDCGLRNWYNGEVLKLMLEENDEGFIDNSLL